jgi:hypothetical protein
MQSPVSSPAAAPFDPVDAAGGAPADGARALPSTWRKAQQYLQRNYRYWSEDPEFFVMKTMARFEFARSWATRPRTPQLLAGPAPSQLVSMEGDVRSVVSTLHGEGYYVGFRLAPHVRDGLRELAYATPCYADRDAALPFRVEERAQLEERLGRPLKVASYFDRHERWALYRELAQDEQLRAIASGYLGCEPVLLRSELAWSFPGQPTRAEKIATAQVFHCDINDYKTLKFFFYLTDVGPDDGPHSYIKKEPRSRTLLHQLLGQRVASIPEQQLVETYGAGQVVTVCGPAGLGFVGDPYYFHRGSTPTQRSRLMLQIEVGCRRYRTWYYNLEGAASAPSSAGTST